MGTVVWFGPAQNHLATVWMAAPDRATVSAAANQIDRQLREDPYANSESRSGNTRVMLVPPLGVAYDVKDEDRIVTVWAVWRY